MAWIEKHNEAMAVATSAAAAHVEHSATYRGRIDAASNRHRLRIIEAKARHAEALSAAGRIYDLAHPDDVEANRAYRAAVEAADREMHASIAVSSEIHAQDFDAAARDFRASEGFSGVRI